MTQLLSNENFGDTSKLKGRDFEFLISPADIEIKNEDFDRIMTPDSFPWTKTIKKNWLYYKVGMDEFSYSWEAPGIQMIFNEEIKFEKAKLIADEVSLKLSNYSGQKVQLIIIPKDKLISF
ncbi:hypothetical protein [Foetidibacter luteolus]|uniref:hypothetical protein n=1 Tax=Foetidibacter luteolus TaxID=2608880 RepID=UPI00129B71F3|nr:hypothetical protein [Foetidibacter luteolus]